jgi:ABC-type Fe3+-hydroxamate transport system substrate-binding protein
VFPNIAGKKQTCSRQCSVIVNSTRDILANQKSLVRQILPKRGLDAGVNENRNKMCKDMGKVLKKMEVGDELLTEIYEIETKYKDQTSKLPQEKEENC